MNIIFVFDSFLIGQDAYIVIASRMPQSAYLGPPPPKAPAGVPYKTYPLDLVPPGPNYIYNMYPPVHIILYRMYPRGYILSR